MILTDKLADKVGWGWDNAVCLFAFLYFFGDYERLDQIRGKLERQHRKPSDHLQRTLEHLLPWFLQQTTIPLPTRHRLLPPRCQQLGTYPPTQVEILQPNEGKYLDKKISFPHEYPPTKLMFIPDDVLMSGYRTEISRISWPLLENA